MNYIFLFDQIYSSLSKGIDEYKSIAIKFGKCLIVDSFYRMVKPEHKQ